MLYQRTRIRSFVLQLSRHELHASKMLPRSDDDECRFELDVLMSADGSFLVLSQNAPLIAHSGLSSQAT